MISHLLHKVLVIAPALAQHYRHLLATPGFLLWKRMWKHPNYRWTGVCVCVCVCVTHPTPLMGMTIILLMYVYI